MLDPQAQAIIDLMTRKAVPPLHTLTPQQARAVYRDRRFYTQPDAPAVGAVQALRIPRAGGEPMPARLLLPPHARHPLPALLYLHGGGWVIGDLDTHDVLCRQLCLGSGCAVLAVDYRLGPEHRFPAAFDDALAAARWLVAHSAGLGLDAARVAIGGDSAGGNLAAAVAHALRDQPALDDQGQPQALAFQLLIYPATDMRAAHDSHQRNGQGYLLTSDTIAWFRQHYMGDAPWDDWRASPLLAARHAGLPPALVLTAGFDPLRDEALDYANRLSEAGVATQYVCFERQIHGFITMGRVIDEAFTAVDVCASALRRALVAA